MLQLVFKRVIVGESSENVLTLMTGTVIAQAIPTAIVPILTRVFTPRDFGLLALYGSIVSILSVVVTGCYELAVRFPKRDDEAKQVLNFLVEWCEPNHLRNLLDTAIHGQRVFLDNFLPREDISHSSLKAMPKGIVSHWLSGNVPLLGMFA